MVKLIAILCVVCALTRADEVRFHWRAVETDGIGYRLYQGPASGFYTNWEVLTGIYSTNCTLEVTGPQWFALAALGPIGMDGTNLLSGLTPEQYWEPPAPIRIVSERSVDGVLWQPALTNDVAAGSALEFWRVRIYHGGTEGTER